jgi:hypothetical protein
MARKVISDSELEGRLFECLMVNRGALSTVIALRKLALKMANDQREICQDEGAARKWERFAGAMRRAEKHAAPLAKPRDLSD